MTQKTRVDIDLKIESAIDMKYHSQGIEASCHSHIKDHPAIVNSFQVFTITRQNVNAIRKF